MSPNVGYMTLPHTPINELTGGEACSGEGYPLELGNIS